VIAVRGESYDQRPETCHRNGKQRGQQEQQKQREQRQEGQWWWVWRRDEGDSEQSRLESGGRWKQNRRRTWQRQESATTLSFLSQSLSERSPGEVLHALPLFLVPPLSSPQQQQQEEEEKQQQSQREMVVEGIA
jgi:hypothetical protein